jgi:hypothetical protein
MRASLFPPLKQAEPWVGFDGGGLHDLQGRGEEPSSLRPVQQAVYHTFTMQPVQASPPSSSRPPRLWASLSCPPTT